MQNKEIVKVLEASLTPMNCVPSGVLKEFITPMHSSANQHTCTSVELPTPSGIKLEQENIKNEMKRVVEEENDDIVAKKMKVEFTTDKVNTADKKENLDKVNARNKLVSVFSSVKLDTKQETPNIMLPSSSNEPEKNVTDVQGSTTEINTIFREKKMYTKKSLRRIVLQMYRENSNQTEVCLIKSAIESIEECKKSSKSKMLQFRKEIDDMEKVTKKFTSEHQLKKGQQPQPVKIRRSVGIQATPAIINKGIMPMAVNGIKVLRPKPVINKTRDNSAGTSCTMVTEMHAQKNNFQNKLTSLLLNPLVCHQSIPVPSNGLCSNNAQLQAPSNVFTPISPPVSTDYVHTAIKNVMPTTLMTTLMGPKVSNAIGNSNSANAILTPVSRMQTISTPLMRIPSHHSIKSAVLTPQQTMEPVIPIQELGAQAESILTGRTTSSGNSKITDQIIDLTEDDGGKTMLTSNMTTGPQHATITPMPSTVVNKGSAFQSVALVSNGSQIPTAQFITIPGPQPGTGSQQFLIVQSPQSQLDVRNVVSALTLHTSAALTNPTTSVTGSNGTAKVNFITNIPQNLQNGFQKTGNAVSLKHPAPLPKTPPQQVIGTSKGLPPKPNLKLSQRDDSIILSWTLDKTVNLSDHEDIASYQLYAYQEGAQEPVSTLWKKVGSVQALELPMACTLTHFIVGHIYHFAVRSQDIKNRVGAFSEPRSICLEKTS